MSNTKTLKQRIQDLRNALVAKYGARKYRINAAGEVHIFSTMPNSIFEGWWLMGDLDQAEDWMGIERQYA